MKFACVEPLSILRPLRAFRLDILKLETRVF